MTIAKSDQVPRFVCTDRVACLDFDGQELPVLFENEIDLLT